MTQDSPYINDSPSSPPKSATSRPRRWTTTDPAPSCTSMLHPARDSGIDIPQDPLDVYPELINGSDLVCQTCFRRLHRQSEYDWTRGRRRSGILAWVTEHVPEGARFQIAEREYYEQEELADRKPKSEAQRHCWNCGSEQPYRQPPTRSKQEAVDAATGLSVTLEEYAVEHDWLALLCAVRNLKSDPELAGDDDRVFQVATATAVSISRSR